MKPIEFKEANKTLTKPESMTDEECGSLPVFNDGNVSISVWKGSIFDRIKFFFTGKVFLFVFSGVSQPPVYIGTDYPFENNLIENE